MISKSFAKVGTYTIQVGRQGWGIIERMRVIYQQYKLTKWIDKQIKKEEIEQPSVMDDGDVWMLRESIIRKRYVSRTKKTVPFIRDLLISCENDRYLLSTTIDGEAHLFVNPTKGMRFLQTFLKLPSGYIRTVILDNMGFWPILIFFLGGLTLGHLHTIGNFLTKLV